MNWLQAVLPDAAVLSVTIRRARPRPGNWWTCCRHRKANASRRLNSRRYFPRCGNGVCGKRRAAYSAGYHDVQENAYGVADNSYLDSETLHTSAYVLRRLKSVITSKYGRHKLANDGTRFGLVRPLSRLPLSVVSWDQHIASWSGKASWKTSICSSNI